MNRLRPRRGQPLIALGAVLLGWAFAYLKDNPQARIIVHPQVTRVR